MWQPGQLKYGQDALRHLEYQSMLVNLQGNEENKPDISFPLIDPKNKMQIDITVNVSQIQIILFAFVADMTQYYPYSFVPLLSTTRTTLFYFFLLQS